MILRSKKTFVVDNEFCSSSDESDGSNDFIPYETSDESSESECESLSSAEVEDVKLCNEIVNGKQETTLYPKKDESEESNLPSDSSEEHEIDIEREIVNKLANLNISKTTPAYSNELEVTLKNPDWIKDLIEYKKLEEVLVEFSAPDPSKKWREGNNKSSFTYLLLDPRLTENLPKRADSMEERDIWKSFLDAIFYVGKGKRSRPYSHLYEAVTLWNKGQRCSDCKKLNTILEIWKDDCGVVCLHLFQNAIPVEAYTREAAIIDALKLDNLSNIKTGNYYGVAATWSQKKKTMLGVYLLYKAMAIFLNEGERQLCPIDIN